MVNLARRVPSNASRGAESLVLYPKSSSRNVSMIVSVYDAKHTQDGSAYVRMELNQHPDANTALPPQTDSRLATKMYQGRRVPKDYAISMPTDPSVLDGSTDIEKLHVAAGTNRQPITDRGGRRIGYAYSVNADLHLPQRGKRNSDGKAMDIERYTDTAIDQSVVSSPDTNYNVAYIDFDSLQPGPALAPDFRDAQIGASSVYGAVFRDMRELQNDDANVTTPYGDVLHQAIDRVMDRVHGEISSYQQHAVDRLRGIADKAQELVATVSKQTQAKVLNPNDLQAAQKSAEKSAEKSVEKSDTKQGTQSSFVVDSSGSVDFMATSVRDPQPEVTREMSAEDTHVRDLEEEAMLAERDESYVAQARAQENVEHSRLGREDSDVDTDYGEVDNGEVDTETSKVSEVPETSVTSETPGVQPQEVFEAKEKPRKQPGVDAPYSPQNMWNAMSTTPTYNAPKPEKQPPSTQPGGKDGGVPNIADELRKRVIEQMEAKEAKARQADNGPDFSM